MEELARQLEDADSELSRKWDLEHDRYIVRRLLEMMEQVFERSTVQAFRRLTLDGASADEVAAELGMSKGAVYVAKSRSPPAIREEADGLFDP